MLARPPAMEVFCVYAQSDIRMQKQLERHLAALRSADYISSYSACKIDGESKVAEALDERFNTAALILFLISPDYLKADGSHMLIQRLLERHARKEVCLIPILLRPANLAGTPYERLRVLPANGAPISVKRVWHNRDIAFNEIAIALRKIIEDITSAWRAEPALDAPIPLWNVPYPSNPYFTGREMLLAALHAGLRSGRIMALTPAPGSDAVAGGGIGKTQIAIEYAYRHAHDYEAVLWVDASSREALLRDFAALAEILDLPERNLADQESIVRAVRRWLEEHEHWLLIFDQADQPVRLLEFLTLKDSGCILLTSRAVALGTLLDAERLHVGPMDPEEAALFLLRRARILPLNSLLEDVHVVPRVGPGRSRMIWTTCRWLSTWPRLISTPQVLPWNTMSISIYAGVTWPGGGAHSPLLICPNRSSSPMPSRLNASGRAILRLSNCCASVLSCARRISPSSSSLRKPSIWGLNWR